MAAQMPGTGGNVALQSDKKFGEYLKQLITTYSVNDFLTKLHTSSLGNHECGLILSISLQTQMSLSGYLHPRMHDDSRRTCAVILKGNKPELLNYYSVIVSGKQFSGEAVSCLFGPCSTTVNAVPADMLLVDQSWGDNKTANPNKIDFLRNIITASVTVTICENTRIPIHTISLAQKFSKVFEQGTLSDLQIFVQGKTINTHKVVLAANSPVFGRMFESEFKEQAS